ncbi:MAG TPA: peptidoglycan-binding protein [Terriglobales bacterium]|nr:peptidoglycan-binding protein [Terriglobales bacterium]
MTWLLLALLWWPPQHAVPARRAAARAHHTGAPPAAKPRALSHRPGKHRPVKRPAPARRLARRRAVARPPLGIAAARAAQIQQALVQAGYLHHASGHWDASTAAAMKKYQADHRWQTRYVPDARALIALGLGPAPTPHLG